MKGIVKNIIDVITNSSSEVFVMYKNDAKYYNSLTGDANECIAVEKITWKWLDTAYRWEGYMIEEVVGKKLDFVWYAPEENIREQWEKYKEENKALIEEKLIGKYYVNIEDHFEDAYDVIDEARGKCLWTDSRH